MKLPDETDAKLDLIIRVSEQVGAGNAIRAAARVLARAGMQDASLLMLEHADEIMDAAAEMKK